MAVQINVAANQAALTASIQAGVQAYNQKFAQNNQINLSVNQRAFSQPLGRMTGDVKDFEAALAASNARVIAFGASTAVLGGVIRSFKELANVTIDVEKNLADINRVFGLSTSQLQKFSTDLFSVGKQTASSFDDASKAALEFSRQGLKAEEVLIRTKDALTLARVAGISTANSVDALTSTVNGFAATGVTTSQILNKLVAVEQDFAVGAGDLAEALSRTGQAAQEAGVSLDQLNALVTAAQQSTARGGAVIGNALKTIFTRLQRTETLDQLEAFNIAVRDVQGNTLPAVTVLQNFAGAYKNLGDAQRAQLSEQVAGVYQVNILKAIVGDLNKSQGVYAGALQRGASATNEAEVATAKLNQTLDALLKQTATSTQQLANNIGKVTFEPLARYGTEQLKSLVESMNEILEGEGVGSTFANGLLKGIRNVIAGPGAIAAFFTLFKLIQNSFTYLAQALPQIAGITTETQNRKNIEQSILQIMQQQGPVSQALAGSMGNQAAQAQLLLQLARQQTAEYQIQSTLAKQLAVQLAGQGVRVKGSGGLQATRAGGYIPAATRIAEAVGAQAGGYAPGKVVKSPVGGVMNTAEDVKYVPGFAQPFINPPAGSKAGRAHRQNAISRTGVDPYMNSGFIPNFAVSAQTKEFLNSQGFSGKLKKLPLKTKNQINKISSVADVYSFIEKGKYAEDSITGKGIHYVVKEIGEQTNTELRKEASDIALKGNKDLILENIPKGKSSLVDFGVWDENRKLSQSNKNAKVKSLIDPNKEVSFSRQLVGLTNLIAGEIFEKRVAELAKVKKKENSNSRFDFDASDIQKYLGGEAKSGSFNMFDLIAKAIGSKNQKYNQNGESDDIPFDLPIELFVPKTTSPNLSNFSKGFIPNFAPPTSAIRVPWFKKFGNASFDAVQPTLGISKANDTDTFRSSQFRSKAFEKAATDGDPNLFAPLYEDFVFKAMQLVSHPDIRDDLMRGYVLQPGTDQKQSALDAVFRKKGVGVETKGYPKKNLPGSLGGELTRKYETLSKTNPEEAAKLQELIIVFNEVGHENQLPSEFGKTFSQLAGTSYSQILKNSPDLVKGLSAETNSLLNNYVKNPAFLAMNAAKGFVPNFNYNDIGLDALTSKLGREGAISQDLTQFVIDLKNQKYAMGDGFHREIIAKNFGEIVTDEELSNPKNANTYLKGSYDKNSGKTIFYKSFAQSMLPGKLFESKHPYIQTVQNELKSRFAKRQASAPVKRTKLPASEEFRRQYPGPSPDNHFNNGLIPNFASGTDIYKGYAFNNTGQIYNDLYHSEAWDSIEGSTAGAIKYAYHNNKLLLQTNKAISPVLKKAFLSRGVPESAFSPVPDVDSIMRSKNKQEIDDKLKNLGSVQLSSGIQAILEKGYYRKLIKGQQSYNIPGGVSPEELKIFGGADGWVKWQEQNFGPLKWDSHASGFIPNFANQDFEILREIIRLNKLGAISNNRYTSSEEDDKNNITRLYRGVKGISERWNSIDKNNPQAINKAIFEKQSGNKIMNEKEFVNKSFSNLAFSHRLNWPDETENPIPFLSTSKKEDVADMFAAPSGLKGSIAIKNSRLLGNERRYENLYKKYGKEKVKGILYKLSKTGGGKGLGLDFVDAYNSGNAYKGYGNEGEIGLFSRGFIPNLANFNPIKGRNSFQKNWLIETAKKRNLNLNDPNTFTKLATEFAKTYPNDQGMFGLSEGFLPNFAYKQAVMGLEESMSGNKAVFDTKPFPHIRNKSQPTFSSAVADHGGLSNALSDSMRGQKDAGLMNKGYVPNFAAPQNNGGFDIVRFSSLISKSVDDFGKKLSFKIGTVKENILLGFDLINTSFDPQKIERTAESTAKKIILSVSNVGDQFAQTISSSGLVAISNIRNKLTSQNASQSTGNGSSQRPTAAQMAASFGNFPTSNPALEKFTQGLSKASTAIAIAGPMLAGFIEQAAYGNKKRTDMTSGERMSQSALSTGLSSVTTGMGIGASFGLPGAVVGGLAGTLVALTSAFKAATLTVEELHTVASEYKTETQQSVSAAQSYIETLKTFQTSTDPEIIKKASTSLEQYFKNIEDVQLQKTFRETGNDVDKLATSLKDYEKRRTVEQGRKEEAAKAAGYTGASFKDLTKAGYSASTFGKTPYLQKNEKPEELAKEAITDFSRFFDDLQKTALDESGIKDLQKLVSDQRNRSNFFGVTAFDQDEIRSFLQKRNVSADVSVSLSEMFDNLENEGNLVGSYIIDNLVNLFSKSKNEIKKEKQDNAAKEIVANNFLSFRRTLLEKISDEFIGADTAVKSFESQSSLSQLLPAKLKEINDLIFNSIINNVSAVKGFSLKEIQTRATATLQSQELSRQQSRTTTEKQLKDSQARAQFNKQISETIFSSPINKGKQDIVDQFIAGDPNRSKDELKTFAKNAIGDDVNAVDKLVNSLQDAQEVFKNTIRETEAQTKFKLQEISYNDAINQLTVATSLKQIDLEREKLKITLGQKDATNSLRGAVEKAKIAANESLELNRIETGGEFRYLGLNKRQDFESKQIDSKTIFDKEQMIAENQAIADARKSIIEIAAQDANTKAQNENTNAIFDLNDALSSALRSEGEQQLKTGNKQIGIGKIAASTDIKARNEISRKQFNASKESIKLSELSNFGVGDNATIGDTIAKLRTKMQDTSLTEEAKMSIKETITTLETSAKQIGSNATIFQAKSAQVRRDFEQSAGFVNNMAIGFKSLGKEADDIIDQLGRNLPRMFADGLVDGIKAAIRESDNLGEALMGIAAKFLDEISTAMMKSAMYGLLGSMGMSMPGFGQGQAPSGGKQKGGYIRAQSGMYISGTGSGDKYPAMLENGEYVLNRRAVMAMGGPTSLDKLNFADAPRFASGGSFSNEFTDLKSMEDGMTTYGLENSKLYNEMRDAEVAAVEERRRKAFAKKQQIAAMIGSAVAAVASYGIGAGIKNVQSNSLASGAKGMAESGAASNVSSGLSTYGDTPQFYAETGSTKQNVIDFQAYRKANVLTPSGGYSGGTSYTGVKSFFTGPTNGGQLPWYQRGSMNPLGYRKGKQTGGLIGSRLSDTIPGYMEGGLYNTPIVKNYGIGMQSGGPSSTSNNNSNVVNTTNASNSFNFNTSVNRDGSIEVGSNSTSYAQNDVELSKNLNSKVYSVVLDAIKNEQRFGGSLAGSRQG